MTAKNIFGAFSVAIALFFIWPAVFNSWAEKNALQASLAEHQQVLEARTNILDSYKKEFEKYQKLQNSPAGKNFFELVPLKKNTAELVSAVQTISESSGIQITTIQVGTVSEGSKDIAQSYGKLNIIMEGTGSYISLKAFLQNLESYVRIFNVTTLDIGLGKDDKGIRFKIQATTYFSK